MIVVITGPTGVGKTALSIEVAKHFNTEIISGDSMQVYRQMDIGTAKVTEREAEAVSHHMIDILDPSQPYSVAAYQKDVRQLIETFQVNNRLPLIVGGTGFYIKSVLHDFNFDDAFRDDSIDALYENTSNETLHQQLKTLDPPSAKAIHPNNRKRILQALNRAQQGVPKSEQTAQDTVVYPYLLIVLTMDRHKLYERINDRVEAMFDAGLLEEAHALYNRNDLSKTAKQAIGYKECFAHFEGLLSLEDTKALIKKRSRQYAKRQLTYFKHQFDAKVVDVTHMDDAEKFTEIIKLINNALSK